jgi:tetratricopeptide (TPR) repeat protein
MGAIQGLLDAGGHLALVGEMGTGTSRLASQALLLARIESQETIALRCSWRAPPTDPVDQLVRELTRLSGAVAPTPEALARALEGLVGEGRLLLVVEDIDQTTPETRDLLQHLMIQVPNMAVLVTAMVVPEGSWGHVLPLRPLSLEETRLLVATMLETPSPPAGLAAGLQHMSGGLPALIVMGVRELVRSGALWSEPESLDGSHQWRLDPRAPLEPTATMARIFSHALGSLSEESTQILTVLAVSGEALPLDLALGLANADPSGLALGPLHTHHLIDLEAHEDGDWVLIRRPAIATLVGDGLEAEAKAHIHRRLALLLKELPSTPWREERCSWHLAHGASAADAPAALLHLALQLAARDQQRQALDALDRAAQLPTTDTRMAANLAIARGETLDALAHRDEALAALMAGRQLAEELGDTALLAHAMVVQSQVHQALGDERRASWLAQDVLEMLDAKPEAHSRDPSLPRACLLAATNHRQGGRTPEATALYQRCIDTALSQGQVELAAHAHGGLGTLHVEQGDLDLALQHLEKETNQFRQLGSARQLIPALSRLSVCHRRLGRPDLTFELLDEADDVGRFASLTYERAYAQIARASSQLVLGESDDAKVLLSKARIALQPGAAAWIRLAYREVQVQIRLGEHDPQAALAGAQLAEEEATLGGFSGLAAYFLGIAGLLTGDTASLNEGRHVLHHTGDRRLAAQPAASDTSQPQVQAQRPIPPAPTTTRSSRSC